MSELSGLHVNWKLELLDVSILLLGIALGVPIGMLLAIVKAGVK